MLVAYRKSGDEEVVEFKNYDIGIYKKIQIKIHEKMLALESGALHFFQSEKYDLFSRLKTPYRVSEHPLVKKADIIHLHWISGMVHPNEFFPKILGKPVVWTLHDSNPFTGGCHVPGDCERYQTGCGACPQLNSEKQDDLSRKIFMQKEAAYEGHGIHIVVASESYAERVRKSRMFKPFACSVVPLGVPQTTFVPGNKMMSRKQWKLPLNKTLALYGASYLSENKGFRYLAEALNRVVHNLDPSSLALITFGPRLNLSRYALDPRISVYQMGFIDDECALASIYSGCDMTIIPSIEESFGQTCLESMACGTPPIGFRTGGMPDMIFPYETGLLAELKNTKELADHIEYMVRNTKERDEMGRNARRLVEEKYSPRNQATQYLSLYERIGLSVQYTEPSIS
jgi:glycosyltransferase involved in cell wall biosynthesis